MRKSTIGIGKPTKKEAEILEFVREYRQENGFSPSLVEIARHFERSVPTIHQHVYSLRSKNLLLIDKGKKRSINALHNHKVSEVMIPLMGIISAGGPIEAIRDPKPIEVPRSMLSPGHDYYALKVSGLSMIEEGISDGDIVIVRDQPTVDDGEKAVAYMPDRNEVTLKKIYREKDRIKLVPANQTMKPFYESNVVIQGKVVGVLRKEF
ncbi:MAG TPA: transcriptional repressor LexA [Candidatus Paceibacterota bacterium]|nr:transcriptional repressor LexA [Candidatus Paceibacterota bacterium]HQB57097.1 transcriptional repressor LexA [Candidatus Paceibacterota bacterium]